MNNNQSALHVAAEISERLITTIYELIDSHNNGEPRDDSKFGMVSDLLFQFGSVADVALEEEENSKEGAVLLQKLSEAVNEAIEAIDPLMDEFYVSHIVEFDVFKERSNSIQKKAEEAIRTTDLKTFLVLFNEVEKDIRELEYIPFVGCGWEDIQLDMCDDILNTLDMYFSELTKKHDRLVADTPFLH